jgi:hypothetical protein
MKPETIVRRAYERAANQRKQAFDTLARLRSKAATDPDSIWPELLQEHEERMKAKGYIAE